MKVIAFIPARGNSKGVPRKNLQPIGGIPMVLWSIATADAANIFDKIVVSTEDNEIEETCLKYAEHMEIGNLIIVSRPHQLSMDHVQLSEVALHALRNLEHSRILSPGDNNLWFTLQPTSPLRDTADIIAVYEKACQFGVGTIFSVEETAQLPPGDSYLYWSQGHLINPMGHDPRARVGRQWEPSYGPTVIYRENGSIYATWTQWMAGQGTVRAEPYFGCVTNPTIDINTLEDLQDARKALAGAQGWAIHGNNQ